MNTPAQAVARPRLGAGLSVSLLLWTSIAASADPAIDGPAAADVVATVSVGGGRANESVDNHCWENAPAGVEFECVGTKTEGAAHGFGWLRYSGDYEEDSVIEYRTLDITATAGADYSAKAGTLTMRPGQTSVFIDLPTLDDSIDEPVETFAIHWKHLRGPFFKVDPPTWYTRYPDALLQTAPASRSASISAAL